jgi:hypothetical protein
VEFLKNIERAHDNIDGLIQKADVKGMLKDYLKEQTNIQDMYTFGKQGKGYFVNNLLDSMIASQIQPKAKFEDLLNVAVGGTFGPKDNWKAELAGGKGRVGFNLAKLF